MMRIMMRIGTAVSRLLNSDRILLRPARMSVTRPVIPFTSRPDSCMIRKRCEKRPGKKRPFSHALSNEEYEGDEVMPEEGNERRRGKGGAKVLG